MPFGAPTAPSRVFGALPIRSFSDIIRIMELRRCAAPLWRLLPYMSAVRSNGALVLAPLGGMHPQQVAAENFHQAPRSQMSTSFLGKSIALLLR